MPPLRRQDRRLLAQNAAPWTTAVRQSQIESRTLETWMKLFSESGFRVVEVREPLHPKTQRLASALFIAEVSG